MCKLTFTIAITEKWSKRTKCSTQIEWQKKRIQRQRNRISLIGRFPRSYRIKQASFCGRIEKGSPSYKNESHLSLSSTSHTGFLKAHWFHISFKASYQKVELIFVIVTLDGIEEDQKEANEYTADRSRKAGLFVVVCGATQPPKGK